MADKAQPKYGKGDKSRTTNNPNWRKRYDAIDWGRDSFKNKGFRGKPKQKVPKNDFGIIAVHTQGEPFEEKDLKAIIDGPIAACEPALQAELAKPVVITPDERPKKNL